jgi:hypothetical protein
MFNRNALIVVAGAAIFALDASAASAQGKTRPTSTKRIPITKEAPGEVVTPRVDTVTVFKTDTLRLQGRIDTVTVAGPMRVDTVTQQINMAPIMRGGWYIGLAGGTNLPFDGIRTVNEPAGTGQLQLGYQPLGGALGFRGDVQYSQFSEAAPYADLGPKPSVVNANLDARLNLPFFNHFLGSAARFIPYLIGGGSYVASKDLRWQLEDGVPGGTGPQHAVNPGGWENNFGWNAGLGLGVHVGRKEVFAESRLIQWGRGNSGSLVYKTGRQVPIVFGVNFF